MVGVSYGKGASLPEGQVRWITGEQLEERISSPAQKVAWAGTAEYLAVRLAIPRDMSEEAGAAMRAVRQAGAADRPRDGESLPGASP